jgi:hypothetical protein
LETDHGCRQALAIDPEFANALLYDTLLCRIEADLASSTAEAQALVARRRLARTRPRRR